MINTGPVVALVVAAGSGVRMGVATPKVLLPLGGEPALVHALRALLAGGVTDVVVLTRPADSATMSQRCRSAGIDPGRVRFAEGGAQRQDSVAAGLAVVAADPELSDAAVVLVHDAARPLVPRSVVAGVIAAVVAGSPAVIPVIPVTDTVRLLAAADDPDHPASQIVDRTRLVAVQTPQGFDPAVLRRAHAEVVRRGVTVTDDAGACELIGIEPRLVPGSRDSLKLTEPIDLVLAEAVLAGRAVGLETGVPVGEPATR